jgi:hypothetical protein
MLIILVSNAAICYPVVAMKTPSYTIKNSGRGKVASALCSQMASGKPGENLLRGFSQDAFCQFLARLAKRALVDLKLSEEQLTSAFIAVAAGNASQAKQACADLVVRFEGADKDVSLESYWQSIGSKPVSVDLGPLFS